MRSTVKILIKKCAVMFIIATAVIGVSSLSAPGQVATADRPPVQSFPQSEDVVVETSNGKLFGTLLLPTGKPPFSVVLIVAGSGMTDRDGNTVGAKGGSNALRLIAEGLAQQGIASLRYDKRGVARSEASRAPSNSFDLHVDDAARWIAWLRLDPRFNSVGVVGHSEGSLLGMIAAERGGVRAFVSLAGGGRRADEVLIEQMENAVRAGRLSKSILPDYKTALAELRAGRTVTTKPKEIPDWLWTGLFHPRAQEFLISLIRYDPVVELSKLSQSGVRILVVRGTTDLMGGPDHASLLAAAIGDKPVVIEGMNHELKSSPLDQKANDKASEDPKRPLAPGLMDKIVSFLTAAFETK